MNVILRGLGPQSKNDLSFLSSDQTISYIRKLEDSNLFMAQKRGERNEVPFLKTALANFN